ncbi:MAG: hypothetical protein FWC39_12095 [Bacteroidetes bacterium]|nr:hypothetical protein [Bacteroidota bacterium]MCL2329236.1 hypothetical protein [Bacteroidota bacterium]
MQATVSRQPLNAMQIHFLQSLQFVKTEEMYQELRQIISDYYFKKLDKETDKWWKENDMTTEKFNEMTKDIHYRTPYK